MHLFNTTNPLQKVEETYILNLNAKVCVTKLESRVFTTVTIVSVFLLPGRINLPLKVDASDLFAVFNLIYS